MEHKPSGLLGDFQIAGYLIAAYPVFAISQHPDSSKPFIKTDGRVLKDSPYLDGELPAGMVAGTLPSVPLGIEANVVGAAYRANHPIGPSFGGQVLDTIINIRKVQDCFLQAFWFFFHIALHISKYNTSMWASQVDYCPSLKLGNVLLRRPFYRAYTVSRSIWSDILKDHSHGGKDTNSARAL
jgi:hypothetical protein